MQIDVASKSGGQRLKGSVAVRKPTQPLVTVITAVYNDQPHMAACLESVIRQDYPNVEHIVLDGGSSDGTVDVLRQYDDRIALWRSEPDQGIYDAWNKALLEARGDWICFLGADDRFLPEAISTYMTLANENPQAEYLSSRVKVIYPLGYERIVGKSGTWREFSRSMCALQVGSMHRKSLFERYGHFDTSYRCCADYEFLLRPRDELHSAFMPTVTVLMSAGGVSTSVKALYEMNRAKLETGGLPKALVMFDLRLAIIKHKARPLLHRILSSLKKAAI